MNQSQIKELLTREPTKLELEELIKMAKSEKIEWNNFIRICKEKIIKS